MESNYNELVQLNFKMRRHSIIIILQLNYNEQKRGNSVSSFVHICMLDMLNVSCKAYRLDGEFRRNEQKIVIKIHRNTHRAQRRSFVGPVIWLSQKHMQYMHEQKAFQSDLAMQFMFNHLSTALICLLLTPGSSAEQKCKHGIQKRLAINHIANRNAKCK